jgi:hypothetical protein
MDSSTYRSVLESYDSITLEQMDSVKLLDRTDTKYVFNISKLEGILKELSDHYFVLFATGSRITRYESLYYDSEQLDLYKAHHNERSNRYKVRFRRYVNSDLKFFEIKFKNNKGRTIKNRVKVSSIHDGITDEAKSLLEKHTSFPFEIKPAIWVNYSRITLVSKDLSERLTFDMDIIVHNEEQKKYIDTLVIAELKQAKTSIRSVFTQTMLKQRIQAGSISKYCYGITQLNGTIRKNNFKPQLTTLNKIIYASPANRS